MGLLSDPDRSEAVLIGVHDYTALENLPAVAQNLEGLRAALTDPEVWGLPDTACTVISQPRSVGDVLDTVRDKARRAEDTLLVYYAGHGLTDPHTDELYLALPDSDREREYTSLRYEYLRRAILDQQATVQSTVVILDCCYSGRALLGRMSATTHIADQAVVEGTCLLTASSETRPALSPPGERYTAFTGELITALTEGVPDRPDPLDMDTLYRHVHRMLAGKSRPCRSSATAISAVSSPSRTTARWRTRTRRRCPRRTRRMRRICSSGRATPRSGLPGPSGRRNSCAWKANGCTSRRNAAPARRWRPHNAWRVR